MSQVLTERAQQALRAQVHTCISQLKTHIEQDLPLPEVNFKQRGQSAGSFWAKDNSLRFNAVLYQENPTIFLNEIVPHEVAHWAVFHLFGRVPPHGRQWQWVMTQVFKLPAKRTHQLDVTSVSGPQFRYQCQCEEPHFLSRYRHNKVQRGARYICKKCRTALCYQPSTAHP